MWVVLLVMIASSLLVWRISNRERSGQMDQTLAGSMMLGSPAFANNTAVPLKYTCRGDNINPQLVITNVPNKAKSLVLILHDPDSVSPDFTHWLLWNIPANTSQIAENSTPTGAVSGTNDTSKTGYMGPCPPAGTGTHRYMFELYAIDTTLNLPDTTKRPVLEQSIEKHVVAHFLLTGLFSAEHS